MKGTEQNTQRPPVAPKHPHETILHGETRVDQYFWLRERSDPEVIAYLNAENAYTQEMMQHTQALQEQLYAELRGRIKETDLSVPVQHDENFYYSRTEEGKQYPIFCRKLRSLDAAEEVLLDQNTLAEGQPYCQIGAYEVSPDHQLLAYSVDTTGARIYTLFVKDLRTGELLPEQMRNTAPQVVWANDNQTLFYTIYDPAHRPYKLYRHTIGSDVTQDVQLYHEIDEAFMVGISKTKSKAYLLLVLESTSTSEVHYLPADQPQGKFSVIHQRQHQMQYSVEHHGERFLIVTNDQAQNFKLMEAPLTNPAKQNWHELIPHRDTVLIAGIEMFNDFLVLYEREAGLEQIRISAPDCSNVRYVQFPEPVYTFWPGPNVMFNTTQVRITYSSLVTPNSVVDYNMRTGSWELKKQQEIPSGYDPSLYQSERITATAGDGTQVPISLVYQKGMERDGHNPTLLYGYGSYGFSIDPAFSSNIFSLVDRGFVYAIAHIRGGSELGRAWYDDGKLMHKKNSFTDFIGCAEHLIAQGYTSSSCLAIMGGSAGGLLMGAVINLRPDLFKAVIAKVPFVDVINTMSDPSLPLTVIEYEQWGNLVDDQEAYEYIKSYSPYDNVETKDYPHMLVTAGLNDLQVSYWEPAKWVAKLRTLKTDQNMLLLKTNMEAGHGGASGRFDRLKEIALDYAFLLETLQECTIKAE